MAQKVLSNLSIENARIAFRNFSGKEGKYNAAGQRNFCVLLEQDLAEQLSVDGWNVRWLEPRDPEEPRQPYIQVKVSYGNISPKIVFITSRNKTVLNEETVGLLDWAEIQEVDLIVRPYNWEVNGKSGVKAYLKTMYVTLAEDEFEGKYRDVPDAAPFPNEEDDG